MENSKVNIILTAVGYVFTIAGSLVFSKVATDKMHDAVNKEVTRQLTDINMPK